MKFYTFRNLRLEVVKKTFLLGKRIFRNENISSKKGEFYLMLYWLDCIGQMRVIFDCI